MHTVGYVNETGRHIHLKKGSVIGTAITDKFVEEDEVAVASVKTEETGEKQTGAKPEQKLEEFELDHVPPEPKEKLKAALFRNIDIFVQTDAELTTTNVTEMRINTRSHPPTYQAPRRTPLAHRKALENQIDEMLIAGVIRRSNSPWMARVILVPKKDGSLRLCVDFRKLNAVTIRPAASMPSADYIFFALGKSKFRSALDLK